VSLRRVGLLVWHDLRQVLRDPRLLVAMFGVPLLLAFVADLAFTSPNAVPGRLGIQDQDHSPLSARILSQVRHSQNVTTFEIAAGDSAQAIVNAQPDVVAVLLPPGLETHVLQGDALPLPVFTNPKGRSHSSAPLALAHQAAEETTAVGAAVAAARADAVKNKRNPDTAAKAAEKSALAGFSISRVKLNLQSVGTLPDPIFARQAQFSTGNGVMFMMFAAIALIGITATDRETGRIQRMLWTRLRRRELFLAKGISTGLLSIGCMVATVGVSVVGFGMDYGPSLPLLSLLTLSVAVAVAGHGLLVLGVGRLSVVIRTLGTMLTLAMAAIGGSWWPLDVEPPLLQTAAHVTLNAWASQAYRSLLLDNQVTAAVLVPVAILFGLGIVQAVLGSWLFSRSLRTA